VELELPEQELVSVELELPEQELVSVELELPEQELASVELELLEQEPASVELELLEQELASVELELLEQELVSMESGLLEQELALASPPSEQRLPFVFAPLASLPEVYLLSRPLYYLFWRVNVGWSSHGGFIPSARPSWQDREDRTKEFALTEKPD